MTETKLRLRKEMHFGERVVACFADRPATVSAIFAAAAEAKPEILAVADAHARMTYSELKYAVENVAGNLAQLGFSKGDRIAILVGNRLEFLIIVLASARIGAVVVPMSTRQKRAEVEFVLNQCTALGLVYDAAFEQSVPLLTNVPALRQLIVLGAATGKPFTELLEPSSAPAVTIAEDDDFCLLYTSGTTGTPKGARLTHLGVVHSVLNFCRGMALQDAEISVLAVPASHVTGLVAILLTMIGAGGATVMMPEFKARRFLELAVASRMTHTLLVPAMYNLCLLDPEFGSFALSTWRTGGFGGAPMPEATIERLASALPGLTLLNIYGSTETTSPVTMMPRGAIATHQDTVGQKLPGADIFVMDADGREVPPGVAGELWIGGPMVVPGYWSNPQADATSFNGGYWRSGDVGSIDDMGFVRILDRKKDVINRGGYKIYSIEVENVLAQHPDVSEVAVVPHPDPVLGQLVHAFIVPKRANVSGADLAAHCAKVLSDYKVPTSFTFLDQPLPRNANGKVQKTALTLAQ